MRTLQVILACSALLGGCSTPYTVSNRPDLAALRIVNSDIRTNLAGFAFNQPETCSEPRNLPWPKDGRTLPPQSAMEMKIEPQKQFVIGVGTTRESRESIETCGLIAGFLPQPGASYVLTFRWPENVCSVNVERVESIAGVERRVAEPTLRQRTEVKGQLITTQHCL